MNNKSWQEILNEYTRVFENNRYDRLTKDTETYISDIISETHQTPNKFYRSFGTYRHDITADTSLVKINETKIKEKTVLDYFYDLNAEESDEENPDNTYLKTNYNFSGIVLNMNYATNSNELSLEDLFAEYGYDYLKAMDSSAIAHNKEPIYFEQTKIINEETIPGGYYEILPIGTIWKEKDEWGNDVCTYLEYDGTYCPTIGEILSGKLYIVIKSGEMKPQKIYFNNKFLPTLFINDDKYYASESYIFENQQTLKLCDLCLFHKLGCQIIWDEELIKLTNIKAFKLATLNYINNNLPEDRKITQSDVYFKFYFHVKIKLNNQTSFYYIISKVSNHFEPAEGASQNYDIKTEDIKDEFVDENQPGADKIDKTNLLANYNIFLNSFDNNNATGKLTMGMSAQIPHIILSISMGVSLMLRGFAVTPDEPNYVYELYWYDYMEDDNINYQFFIYMITDIQGITINETRLNNTYLELPISENKIPTSKYQVNMDIPKADITNLSFYFAFKKEGDETIYPFIANDFLLYPIFQDNILRYELKTNNDNDQSIQMFKLQKTNQADNITGSIHVNNLDLGSFTGTFTNEQDEEIEKTIQHIQLTINMHETTE